MGLGATLARDRRCRPLAPAVGHVADRSSAPRNLARGSRSGDRSYDVELTATLAVDDTIVVAGRTTGPVAKDAAKRRGKHRLAFRTASSLMIFAKLEARRSEPPRAARRNSATITSGVYFLREILVSRASIPAAAIASRQLPKCQRPAVTKDGGACVLARPLPARDRFEIAATMASGFQCFLV